MGKLTARKIKMTQVWRNDAVVPVTVLKFEGSDAEKPLFASLKDGDVVRVSGISKGKGFQGVVKRHGFGGGPRTHGQKNRLRAPGSIGHTAAQRVIKGKRMAGHMGGDRVTLKNLVVVEVQPDAALFMVKGAVPGMRGSKIEVRTKE